MRGSRAVRKAELKQMVRAARSERDRALVMIGREFGLRVSEALELRFRDFAGDYLEIRSRKHSNPVRFPVRPEIKKQVRKVRDEYQSQGRQVDENSPVFMGREYRRGGQVRAITTRQAGNIVKALKALVKIVDKLTFHGLRKAFVDHYYRKCNFDLIQTMAYSRHKNPASLVHYIAVCRELTLDGVW